MTEDLLTQARSVLQSAAGALEPTEELFEVLYALVMLEEYDVVHKALQDVSLTKKGTIRHKGTEMSPIPYLRVLGAFCYRVDDTRYITSYTKKLKRLLQYVQDHFDEEYLLVRDCRDHGFSAAENFTLISELDGLTHGLNQAECYREADTFFMYKGKLELGIHRYLWHAKEQILVASFLPGTSLEFVEDRFRALWLCNRYHVEEGYHRWLVEHTSETVNEHREVLDWMEVLYGLRKYHPKKYQTVWKQQQAWFSYFPRYLEHESEHHQRRQVETSVLGEALYSSVKIPRRKVMGVGIQSPHVAAAMVRVMHGE